MFLVLMNFRLEYIVLEISAPLSRNGIVIQSLFENTSLKEKGSNFLGAMSVDSGNPLAWKELFAPWVIAELPVAEEVSGSLEASHGYFQ